MNPLHRSPQYHFNEVKSEQVTIRESYGEQDYTATLCEFFGDFFIVLVSYSSAQKINCKAHSNHAAEAEFNRFVQLHNLGKAVA